MTAPAPKRIVGPALMAVLALILIVRTRGVYTRWLAANIIVCVLALTYVLDPNVFRELLRQGVQEGMKQIDRAGRQRAPVHPRTARGVVRPVAAAPPTGRRGPPHGAA